MDRIVIDQTRIRISPEVKVKPGSEFPRPLKWWRKTVPIWLDASEDGEGRIVLEPSGHRADGVVLELTPAKRQRDLKYALRYPRGRRFLDFSDALVPEPTPREQFPISNARFTGGRTYHWVKDPGPDGWHTLLEAACGKTGYLASGHGMTRPALCKGCLKTLAE